MKVTDSYPKTILLVDDDSDDQELFEDALNMVAEGIILKTAENGIEALKYLQMPAELPELVFLDLNMPLMNGYDCLKELKASEPTRHIPVIIFSTSVMEETVNAVYESGASLYAVKPNSFAALKELLKRILALDWQKPFYAAKENFILQA
ncbi:Response regulator rcp1 [Dyadobacter sp. CECT 9275]|uniref:Response regulator rcp1 n=1 Tax=Dyadobacter helix TaxID=2822344 RepID=A0A916N4I2_9BACT|nr:response regulator [Dyadobacter sp. CECT 9275]CAG5000729.1 Response regulator rcp1 [Dyadobacter sp. CECT 9275]